MKKNIIKAIVALTLIITAMVSYNTEVKAQKALGGGDCEHYCPNSGNGCILIYSNGAMTTCVGGHS